MNERVYLFTRRETKVLFNFAFLSYFPYFFAFQKINGGVGFGVGGILAFFWQASTIEEFLLFLLA